MIDSLIIELFTSGEFMTITEMLIDKKKPIIYTSLYIEEERFHKELINTLSDAINFVRGSNQQAQIFVNVDSKSHKDYMPSLQNFINLVVGSIPTSSETIFAECKLVEDHLALITIYLK